MSLDTLGGVPPSQGRGEGLGLNRGRAQVAALGEGPANFRGNGEVVEADVGDVVMGRLGRRSTILVAPAARGLRGRGCGKSVCHLWKGA